jgi:Na+-transporting NADH:ubiquinone oxidoreductase subunit A
VRTRLGANVADLVDGELHPGASRIVSGSVLSGRQASGWGRHLGRHHLQVCAIPETVQGALRTRRWTTARRGRPGPMLPTEDFERVLPLDLLPTPLLRALVVGDDEAAVDLGCLELDEEDLALCTYVCPGKLEYGALLSRALARIEATL